MTRKIPLIFMLTGVFTYLILLSVLGKGGYLHNKALESEVQRLRYASEVLSLEVDSLRSQRVEMHSVDAIKDAAFKYGYQVEGEQVFYFEDIPEEPLPRSTTRFSAKRPAFEGLENWKIALLSALVAVVVSLLVYLTSRKIHEDG